jgi:glycosyltransferase involved in cell wall biosynthesis
VYDVVEVSGAGVARERRRLELAVAFRDAVLALHARRRVDVVETTDYGLEGMACVTDGRLAAAGIRTVVRMHTPDSMVCDLNGEVRLSDSPAVHASEGDHFRAARHVSSPSHAMARELEARWGVGGDKVEVLPNPVDLAPQPGPSRRRGRGDGPFRLCYFGRLERRKGVHVLAEALTRVLPRHGAVDVVFVGADTRTGGGSNGRSLRQALAPWNDRVRFTGFQVGEARRAALSDADAVCLPSLWENFPYAGLEALACGRPVIATSGSGFEEIVRHGVDGLLVPPGDAAGLAAAIETVVTGDFAADPERLAEGVAAFDGERLLPRFEDYYEGLAA